MRTRDHAELARHMRTYTEMPNALIEDVRLHYTTKKVAFVMLLFMRKNREIRQTVYELAVMAKCSPATVQQAIQELEDFGYIERKRNYRYSLGLARPVYAASSYRFKRNCSRGYTLIPAKILQEKMSPGTFAVLLYLYRCAGRVGRAYPSLRHMASDKGSCPGIAKATVCRALAAFQALEHKILLILNCKPTEKSFRCNSYYLYIMVVKKSGAVHFTVKSSENVPKNRKKFFELLGGLIFEIRPPVTR